MSEDWDERWALRKEQVQPMIDEALICLKRAVEHRNSENVDLCRLAVQIQYARFNLKGVRGMTGSVSPPGGGIGETCSALLPLENALMGMWMSEDVEVRRALLTIFDRTVVPEIQNLSEDPYGDLRDAARDRADEERYSREEQKP